MSLTYISDIHADAVAALAADPVAAAQLGLPVGCTSVRATRWIARAHRDWRAGRSRTYAWLSEGQVTGVAIVRAKGGIACAGPCRDEVLRRLAADPGAAGCAFRFAAAG